MSKVLMSPSGTGQYHLERRHAVESTTPSQQQLASQPGCARPLILSTADVCGSAGRSAAAILPSCMRGLF